MVDTVKYIGWLEMAGKDLNGAKILFEHDADYGLVCFHCQQSVEKSLKGYLIFKTGMLTEGHSLIRLGKKAAEFEDSFKKHIKDFAFINAFYIETRYPAEDPLIVTEDDAIECINLTEKFLDEVDILIKKSLTRSPAHNKM